jgi:adenosylcobyric acid synthase
MFQGTGSDVGKSTVVAGLCRAARRRGLRVRPFKPQNMSNNAAVTADGGEIGRAQALQARAAGVAPSVHMNPVLLKPDSDTGCQVVLRGRVHGRLGAGAYMDARASLLPAVLDSFAALRSGCDLVVVEGAGSPAEINLRHNDIANMGFAAVAGVPVVLVGDIDRGGVIASLVGTRALLAPEDGALVAGFVVNKFRGDPRLFDAGLAAIVERTGWRSFGVLPHVPACARLPSEDAVVLERGAARRPKARAVRVAVPMLARIANFDDLDPLAAEPDVEVVMVPPGAPLPGDADLVVLPGSKATLADLAFARRQGWDVDLAAHVRRGGAVLGLCGGYQMLGVRVRDPDGVEGPPGEAAGLGLLEVETALARDKVVRQASGVHVASGAPVAGYEIHAGGTTGAACDRPFLRLDGGRPDGAVSASRRVAGTYVHGLFSSDAFRRAFLAELGAAADPRLAFEAHVEAALDELADALEAHLDVDGLLAVARP